MTTRWVADQIMAMTCLASAAETNSRRRLKWRPGHVRGVPYDNSASQAVLQWLIERVGSDRLWWTRAHIIVGTGRSQKSVDWALIYLRTYGHVECSRDVSRNDRYLRYRAARRPDDERSG